MQFATRLSSLMKERGWSKYRLSKAIGCHATTITNWLEETTEPQMIYLNKLAEVFGVSVEYLKGETDSREIKKAPAPKDERSMWDDRKRAMLITLFERLSPEDQNDVIFELLQKAQSQIDQGDQ